VNSHPISLTCTGRRIFIVLSYPILTILTMLSGPKAKGTVLIRF
jgi:hypothetical protein